MTISSTKFLRVAISFSVSAALVGTATTASAMPVELDTPDAHIIVVRPVDIWSGDSSAQDDSLDMVKAKRANYVLEITYGRNFMGGPLWLQRADDHPVVNAVSEALKPHGFDLRPNQGYFFGVKFAENIEASRFDEVREAQAANYRQIIIDQGDPDTLGRRIMSRKVAGNVLSLLTLGIAGSKFGAVGASTTLGSGIAGDVYQAPSWVPTLSPALLPALDTSAFKSIDMRRLQFRGGMVGQMVIAYRGEKTPEIEREALVKGIVAATGADTTPEEIKAARASDFAYRQVVWKECVAASKCGDGAAAAAKKNDAPDSAKALQ